MQISAKHSPEIQEKPFGGRDPPGPAGELTAFPQIRLSGLQREGQGRREEGKGEGRKGEGDGVEGEGKGE